MYLFKYIPIAMFISYIIWYYIVSITTYSPILQGIKKNRPGFTAPVAARQHELPELPNAPSRWV